MLYTASIISQYANSPRIAAILSALEDAAIPDWDAFFADMWDLTTATGYGLDVWGRIVGVSRVLQIPEPGDYFGFDEGDGYETFGHGPFYAGGASTNSFSLSDDAYRALIFAKAALNITNASASSINAIMMALFSTYGNCYVRDDGGMAMTYVFGDTLSSVDFAIVTQSGVLPRPAGVQTAVEQP